MTATYPPRPGTGRATWPTCPTCGQPAPARAVCACGHAMEVHDIRKGTREVCSHHEGPKATPCGCEQYEEVT